MLRQTWVPFSETCVLDLKQRRAIDNVEKHKN
jgi:hypothetical protein